MLVQVVVPHRKKKRIVTQNSGRFTVLGDPTFPLHNLVET